MNKTEILILLKTYKEMITEADKEINECESCNKNTRIRDRMEIAEAKLELKLNAK